MGWPTGAGRRSSSGPGALLVFVGFAAQALAPASLRLMVAVAIVFDLGVQAAFGALAFIRRR